ncbi:hypothetical protein QTH87_20445 [Variovorax sp. J22P168]|uniref:hypothetical protein n=1 Tax=Variovorax jilinensis TaxID=3053513 RepID=UPI0025763C89|nr:hypothetical protein [Variovorax sp. J22P168]MDM0014825.1 hypothetical protein [Variovorax sp. J22P168]
MAGHLAGEILLRLMWQSDSDEQRQPAFEDEVADDAKSMDDRLHRKAGVVTGADDHLLRAHRVANRTLRHEDIDWLCNGFSAFLASSGRVPLERCLRLPTNERALRRARRDDLLCAAWLQTDPALSGWQRSEALAMEVRRFGARKWPRWSALDAAPEEASAMDQALFEAFRSHERVPGTAMQLHNIAAQCRGE